MDPNDQPPSMPDAPDKEKMEQVRSIYNSAEAARHAQSTLQPVS